MDKISNLRKSIDAIDDKLLELIISRADLVKEIGNLKNQSKMPVVDTERESEIFKKIMSKAKESGLDQSAIKKIWQSLIEISYKIEGDIK